MASRWLRACRESALATSTQVDLRAPERGSQRTAILVVLLVCMVVRLLHLGSALNSPLTFQPGPDEDYCFRFGQAVASGSASDTAEFAFMDPAYGYMLGLLFKLFRPNLYLIYFLQILVDTATAWGLYLIGRELGRPRGGLCAALLYSLTCTAVLFCTTLLKATWVASFMTWWVLLGLVLLRKGKPLHWALFGLLCGYGIALRSNLALTAGLGWLLLAWLNLTWAKRSARQTALAAMCLAAGLAVPIALLSFRNDQLSKSFSPLPNNGGIVLYQLYNPDNPSSVSWLPKFVNYLHPTEIWRGYAHEAERRIGHALSPHEIDQYWRGQAIAYIQSHPAAALGNVVRKMCQFVAYTEVPNNRSLQQERVFSPVLRILPSPFGWLFALGVPGMLILLRRDRRALLTMAPIAATVATVSVFFVEDRYRFHCVPMLALGAGLFLEDLYVWLKGRQRLKWIAGLSVAASLGGLSVALAQQMPQPPISWNRAVWGYIKMGHREQAMTLAAKVALAEPTNSGIQEALGYMDAAEGRFESAIEHYRRATQLKPDSHVAHYNLARVLMKVGRRDEAKREAQIAADIAPLPEYVRVLTALTQDQRSQDGLDSKMAPGAAH